MLEKIEKFELDPFLAKSLKKHEEEGTIRIVESGIYSPPANFPKSDWLQFIHI